MTQEKFSASHFQLSNLMLHLSAFPLILPVISLKEE
jgi:hypothetical protein